MTTSYQFDDAAHVRERLAPALAVLEDAQAAGDAASDDEPPAPPGRYFRRADLPLMIRGAAAAATWIFLW